MTNEKEGRVKFVHCLAAASDIKSGSVIIIIIYFENVHLFQAKQRLGVCPYEVPPHIPEHCSFSI